MTPDIKLLFHLLSAMDMIARMKIPTAAILVIGDEILSGKTEDQNARLLIGELRDLGVALRRIVTIPDDVKRSRRRCASCRRGSITYSPREAWGLRTTT
jgi:hypothetical protein